jgi:hypothetical protein
MKRVLYILGGMLIAGSICVAITWMLGAFFGPLYQGEDEATRNFKIFLAAFILSVIAGGIISNKLYKKE